MQNQEVDLQHRRSRSVLPARAGVVLQRRGRGWQVHRAPRASGGGPRCTPMFFASPTCSPRERGWSLLGRSGRTRHPVLPARAGVVLLPELAPRPVVGAPRASGGGPSGFARTRCTTWCSPRERGWSQAGQPAPTSARVLPARAGVVPRPRRAPQPRTRAPRASGGGPGLVRAWHVYPGCSPRERGWSQLAPRFGLGRCVLPARAGVVRLRLRVLTHDHRAPRASGGGPRGALPFAVIDPVLPARAGMVRPRAPPQAGLPSVPRASGDGPASATSWRALAGCSPGERGWSLQPQRLQPGDLRAPRASGDGPNGRSPPRVGSACSARAGTVPTAALSDAGRLVLPARAGWSPCELNCPVVVVRRAGMARGTVKFFQPDSGW